MNRVEPQVVADEESPDPRAKLAGRAGTLRQVALCQLACEPIGVSLFTIFGAPGGLTPMAASTSFSERVYLA